MHRTSVVRYPCRFDLLNDGRGSLMTAATAHFVTLRMADAVPDDVLGSIGTQRLGRKALEQRSGVLAGTLPQPPYIPAKIIEDYLDAGSGSCRLAQPEVAELVAAALAYADGCAYQLKAWCIMPNHVHAVLRMNRGETLSAVVAEWKTFTARKARRMVLGEPAFWQPEYYARVLKDEAEIADAVDAVLANPPRAGLANWPWVWSDRNDIDLLAADHLPPGQFEYPGVFASALGAASL